MTPAKCDELARRQSTVAGERLEDVADVCVGYPDAFVRHAPEEVRAAFVFRCDWHREGNNRLKRRVNVRYALEYSGMRRSDARCTDRIILACPNIWPSRPAAARLGASRSVGTGPGASRAIATSLQGRVFSRSFRTAVAWRRRSMSRAAPRKRGRVGRTCFDCGLAQPPV